MLKRLLTLLLVLFLTACSSNNPEQVVIDNNTPIENDEPTVEVVREDLIPLVYQQKYKEMWNEYYNINSDYIGQVFFKSGLLSQPVTYYDNNDYYLRRNFETGEYDIYGTVFEDHNCSYFSQNTILYGHHVPTNYDENWESIMFTPLDKLMKEENYEDNKTVYLLLQDELREYEVVSVFHCDLYSEGGYWYPNPNLIYYYSEYDEAYFERYKYTVKDVEFYDTGKDFNYSDRFLTLQTCVENRDDLRLIVLCKQVGTYYYE